MILELGEAERILALVPEFQSRLDFGNLIAAKQIACTHVTLPFNRDIEQTLEQQ